MGFIFSKKASSSSDNDSELYQDLHSEDMKTRIDIYMNRSNTLENRLVALRKIGLFTFTGMDKFGKHCHLNLLLQIRV